jgi:three-Cys-motif partner protein
MSPQDQLVTASDGLPARQTGSWVHDKKFYLERYLSVVIKAVGKKWAGKLSYIDLFSGPGRSVIRDTNEEVEGSPLVALGFEFAHYVFVDTPDVISILRERTKQHPKKARIALIEGDCNDVIDEVRAASPADHLALAFIDPTGLQIRFDTIRRLVNDRKVDLLMTIQLGMGVTMNLPQYAKSNGEALTNFLGNTDWRNDLDAGGSISQTSGRIMERYISQLKKLGYETAREIPIRTGQNNLLLYFMVLASRHPRGPDLWKKITEIAPSGQRRLGLS